MNHKTFKKTTSVDETAASVSCSEHECTSDKLRNAASRMRMNSRMAGMLILDLGFVKEANICVKS